MRGMAVSHWQRLTWTQTLSREHITLSSCKDNLGGSVMPILNVNERSTRAELRKDSVIVRVNWKVHLKIPRAIRCIIRSSSDLPFLTFCYTQNV